MVNIMRRGSVNYSTKTIQLFKQPRILLLLSILVFAPAIPTGAAQDCTANDYYFDET
jgi:hypothetical protein